jgi:hypothetical protein
MKVGALILFGVAGLLAEPALADGVSISSLLTGGYEIKTIIDVSEPILKVVESGESVVIRYVVPVIEGGTTCGRQNTAGWRSAGACGIPAT